jgi:hypothetical protein
MGFNGQLMVPESVSNATNTGSVALGTRVWYNGCEYVYAYNGTGTAIPQGTLVNLASNTSGYTINFPPTALVGIPYGVNRNTAVSGTQYFWVCQRGYSPLCGSETTMVPGSLLRIGTSGLMTTYTIATAMTNTYWLPINVVVSIETTASTLNGWGYVNLG